MMGTSGNSTGVSREFEIRKSLKTEVYRGSLMPLHTVWSGL
jgi:hypothetical protein